MQSDFTAVMNRPDPSSKQNIPTSSKIDLQPPPFSEVHERPDYQNSFVTIELNNNTRIKGRLLQFNSSTETIGILKPRALHQTEIDMSSIKFMRLEMPYQLALENSTAGE